MNHSDLLSHENERMTTPRQHVEDALRRLTDDSLTFRVDEDEHSVVAAFELDGRLVTHAWPKWEVARYMETDPQAWAEDGVRELLAKGNRAP